MNKIELYKYLDIDSPADFKYFENFEGLMECEEYIDKDNLLELFADEGFDFYSFGETVHEYFRSLLDKIPESETNIYINIESIEKLMTGMIFENMQINDWLPFISEISKFRKWYVFDCSVIDVSSGNNISLMNALYGNLAANLLGEEVKYKFDKVPEYEVDGYDISLSGLVDEVEDVDEN